MISNYTVTNAIVDMYSSDGSQAVLDCFRRFIIQHHIETFACGEVDLVNRKRTVFHAMEWPAPWRAFYFKSGMQEQDPVLDALERQRGSVTWSELRGQGGLSTSAAQSLKRAAAEGWTDGLVVPIHRGGMHYGMVSLIVSGHVLGEDQKKELTAVSLMFHQRMRQLVPRDGFRIPPAALTPREIECVQLIARGLSDVKAGEVLGIRGSTMHEHAERAKRKLDAHSRAELVAIAKSFAIIVV